MNSQMRSLNIELTTCCPLRCPQCYCGLEGGKMIDLNLAKQKIQEASKHGVTTVNLSGGETLCYPHLTEIIAFGSGKIKNINIAVSGWGFSEQVLKDLVEAGVTGISVSLNGSTEEINRVTRDGYGYAMEALHILNKYGFHNTCINWVMYSSNAEDFLNIVSIAELYHVGTIDIMMFKPDAQNQYYGFPSAEQMQGIADIIHNYRGPVKILVETCFSQMLGLVMDSGWVGNLNIGITKGCGAGRFIYCVDVDGNYTPCRHLNFPEKFDTLDEYLEKSQIFKNAACFEGDIRKPCSECWLEPNCRPCLAIPSKLHGEFFKGFEPCEIWRLRSKA